MRRQGDVHHLAVRPERGTDVGQEPGLPHAAGADHRHQPPTLRQGVEDGLHLGRPTHGRGRGHRHTSPRVHRHPSARVRRHGRPAGGRPLGRAGAERGVVRQHAGVHLGDDRPGGDPELVAQGAAERVVRLERLRLAAEPVGGRIARAAAPSSSGFSSSSPRATASPSSSPARDAPGRRRHSARSARTRRCSSSSRVRSASTSSARRPS